MFLPSDKNPVNKPGFRLLLERPNPDRLTRLVAVLVERLPSRHLRTQREIYLAQPRIYVLTHHSS